MKVFILAFILILSLFASAQKTPSKLSYSVVNYSNNAIDTIRIIFNIKKVNCVNSVFYSIGNIEGNICRIEKRSFELNKIITSKPIVEYPFYENGKMILYLKIKDLGIKDINYGTIQITDRQGKYSKLVKYHKNDLLDKIKCNN